jgi:tripartite ATP-independent transporter DctM subunit
MSTQVIAIFILLGSFGLMILLRFPIVFSIGLASVLCLTVQGSSLTAICLHMVRGISSFNLMAVPFFVTMGLIMVGGGIAEKLIKLADSLVGWMHGGLAQVNVLDSFFFGGISGSATADTASLGSILIPIMVKNGYSASFAAAITIASSCQGLLIPPSHSMVIYATSAGGVSVGNLFLAGYLPGVLLALSLMIGSYIIAVKRSYPKGSPFSIINVIKQLYHSCWALATIVIVVVGVVFGVFTATESAAIAVVYSLFVSIFVYKGLNWKGVWCVLEDCIDTLANVLILIAASSAFSYCLATLQVPGIAANFILSISDNPIIVALMINLILILLGCIMDMIPIILLVTPILLPIAISIGIHPIQFGIMLILNCGIGLLTPPVGTVLFIGSAISKVPVERLAKATLPFYICMIITLLLITFIPEISLFLPNLLSK